MRQKRLEAFFSGRVHGVGFRYTAERLARRFPITGYVCNLDDGRVEIAAEGDEAILVEFLKAVRESSMQPYIQDLEVRWSEAECCFKGFRIGY